MSNKPAVLMMIDAPPPMVAQLESLFTLHRAPQIKDMPGFLAQNGAEIMGILTTGGAGASAQIINALPNLKIISCFSAGYENIDLAAAKARNIPITTAAGANAKCVADMAFALMLGITRNLVEADAHVRAGKWRSGEVMGLRDSIWGRKLGILGLGAIGMEIAKRAQGFEMDVSYHNRRPRDGVPYRYVSDAKGLAAESEIFVVACPSTPETRGLVSAEVLDALGAKGFLVNIARGDVIDEPALITALEKGTIAGAGLDVFAHEPEVPPAFFPLKNVVLSPHYAGFTRYTFRRLGELAIENLLCAFSGKPLLTPLSY